jgi:predicted CXXCH cytochrome family protein
MIALAFGALVAGALWVTHLRLYSQRGSGRLAKAGVRLLTLDTPFPAEGRFAADPYVGSKVCSECHPGEAALHASSGHSMTLTPAGRQPLSRRLNGRTVMDPEQPDVLWSYRLRDSQLHLARQARGKTEECILEYAFGSGHHATTFVSVIDPKIPAILEHRLTYYTQRDALGVTPGQIAVPPPPWITPRGGALPADISRRCFQCHTTQIAAHGDQSIDEPTMIPNVTCERCHGPGRAHVAAARTGLSDVDLALPFGPKQWTAEGLHSLCGACHRHPADSEPEAIRPDEIYLARFQPVGLMQSRCYLESGGSFSCVTCHDPHARASTDRTAYNAICLRCHTGDAEADTHAPAGGATVGRSGSPCPRSPRVGCVDCHMPRVDAGQFYLVSDHWIRVRTPGQSAHASGAPAAQGPLLAVPKS